MYQIYTARLDLALVPEAKIRPVVVMEEHGNSVKIAAITSRWHDGEAGYIKLNDYLVHGYVNVRRTHTIGKQFLKKYVRDCTLSEQEEIEMEELAYIYEESEDHFMDNVMLYSSMK